MNIYRELLIGCGHSREKRVFPPCREPGSATAEYEQTHFMNLTTLDVNPECKPDILCNLCRIPFRPKDSGYSLISDHWDEIHAYEVLEHIGPQGDYEHFFTQFGEFWRILKPNGYFCATVPHWQSIWAWGDPGHTRIINEGSLLFLDHTAYDKQLGKTAMSDYRAELGDTNFKVVEAKTVGQTFQFILRAIK